MKKNDTAKYLANLTIRLLTSFENKNTNFAIKGGLTGSEFKCLCFFGADKKVMSNSGIANEMNLSASRLTRIIDGLVKKGFMTREYDKKDWRSVNITLSRKGKSFIQKSDKLNEDLFYKILSEINISQQQSLVYAIEKICSSTEKWLVKGK